MALVLVTGQTESALDYLHAVRKSRTQADVADHLGVSVRQVRRWEVGDVKPPIYLAAALQQMLPLEIAPDGEPAFRFIDLFAGIGGNRTAFEGIGGHCVFTSEWDSYAQKTYAENNPDGHQIYGDITQIDAKDVPDHDVLLAGFPCQPFSIAGVSKKNSLGRAHGFKDETQGTLFFDICRIIEKKKPRAFLLENVKNLVSHDKGRTFDVMRRALTNELGYHIHCRVIDGAHFVPQHRERILIVGFREPEAAASFDWNAMPLPPKESNTLANILHRTDGTEPKLAWDEGKYFDHAKKRVFPKYTLTDHLWTYLQNYAAKHRAAGNGFGFGLVGPNNIARTLSARYYKDGSEILIDQGARKNPRRLTPRECARLMGFPDTFRIPVSDTRAYKQFADSTVVPLIAATAKLIASSLLSTGTSLKSQEVAIPKDIMSSRLWTKEQVKLAFHLYCQLPYGRIHGRNPEIIELAGLIGRTPDAAAMKMLNIASLDPAITTTGRVALGHASALDEEVWAEFHANWEGLAIECSELSAALARAKGVPALPALDTDETNGLEDYTGETRRVVTEQRIKQHFFRRAVLSSHRGRCCMTGLAEPRLLLASHIVPWSKDKTNRLNPSNGLCLSALHDRAFDRGLLALADDFTILVSRGLKNGDNEFIERSLQSLHGKPILMPQRFTPNREFIARHRTEIFEPTDRVG